MMTFAKLFNACRFFTSKVKPTLALTLYYVNAFYGAYGLSLVLICKQLKNAL